MRIYFVVFIAVAMAVVIGVHALLYFSWLRFFGVTDPTLRRIIGIALAVLSVSFLLTSILVHWRENLFTGGLYALAATWMGMLLYLFMATIAVWLILGVNHLFAIGLNARLVAAFFLLVAVIVTGYGLWNAQHPVITNVSVSLKNLPPPWQGKKIVQISDVHLGAIHRKGFIVQIVKAINEINPDAVFITGDLFDGVGSDLNHLADPLNDLHPPLGTYFVTGNHETYVGVEKALTALKSTTVNVLDDEIVDLDGIQLVGIDYPQPGRQWNPEATLARLDRSRPSILLLHVPTPFDRFKQAGINLQLSGHTHVGQMWPFNYITRKVYSGYDYGLHADGDYALYTSSGAGTWGPPLRIGNRPEIVVVTFE